MPSNKPWTDERGPLLSFGHLPLEGKTADWEYSGYEFLLLRSRVHGWGKVHGLHEAIFIYSVMGVVRFVVRRGCAIVL